MDNTLIDDRRIRVDFSQSVAKLWKQFRHGKRSTKDGCFKCGAADHFARDCNEEPDGKDDGPKYILKDRNTQHGDDDHKSYDMLFDEENINETTQKQAKKIKTRQTKLEISRHGDHDAQNSDRNKHDEDRSRRNHHHEKDKRSGRDERHSNEGRTVINGDHYRSHDGDYKKSGSSRDGKEPLEGDRNDEGDQRKRKAETERHRSDERSYERSREHGNESYREKRRRDGSRDDRSYDESYGERRHRDGSRDDRSYERSKDRDDESHGERRRRDGSRHDGSHERSRAHNDESYRERRHRDGSK